jgi:uncharacterized protein (TIGR03435 family)
MKGLLWFALAGLMITAGSAQTPSFEVASIRPSPTGVGGPVGASFKVEPGGRLIASGATLRDLVVRAFSVQYFQVADGERWWSSERFEVTARAASGTNPNLGQLNALLGSLLQERFGLVVHRETRNLSIFALAIAGPGRTGPGLRVSRHDCRAILDGRDPLDSSIVDGDRTECQPKTMFVAGTNGSQITFTRVGLSMRQLASLLTPFARRTIVDRTALDGTYDIELTFSPDIAFLVTQDGVQQAPQAEGGSLATALREQLGLKLESTRGSSEVLVIDAAHRPSPD